MYEKNNFKFKKFFKTIDVLLTCAFIYTTILKNVKLLYIIFGYLLVWIFERVKVSKDAQLLMRKLIKDFIQHCKCKINDSKNLQKRWELSLM